MDNNYREGGRLDVISFAPIDIYDSVVNALTQGSWHVNPCDRDNPCVPVQRGNTDAVVLIFGSSAPADDCFEQISQSFTGLPTLGVFTTVAGKWCERFLATCTDFTSWPCLADEIGFRLRRTLQCRLRDGLSRSKPTRLLSATTIVGNATALCKSMQRIDRFAQCDASVLIEGETGTGKELAARAIHYQSARASQPFIPVNCGALPDSLIENEFFGHAKGAFTGAGQAYAGLISQAQGGTLFLDEVEALSHKGQVSILRFLEQQEYRPLGDSRTRSGDVRVIAASNRPLCSEVELGGFRQDLLYRLSILTVRIPPLRERAGDVDLLTRHFMDIYRRRYDLATKRLNPVSQIWMNAYEWPGNVRELQNHVHRSLLLSEGDIVTIERPADMSEDIGEVSADSMPTSFQDAKQAVIADFEKRYLSNLLADTGGNVTLAASRARKERRAFGKLLKKHGLERERFSASNRDP